MSLSLTEIVNGTEYNLMLNDMTEHETRKKHEPETESTDARESEPEPDHED